MPDKTPVFSSDSINVWVTPATKTVEHQFLKPTQSKDFRAALMAGVAAMTEHRCTKWLSDDRKNGPLAPDDLTWAEETWVSKAVAAGWKSWALVLPTEVAAQMDLQKHAKLHRSRGVVVVTFLTPELARDWLATR